MSASFAPSSADGGDDRDRRHMARAVELAALARSVASPNPWVGRGGGLGGRLPRPSKG